MPLTMTKSGITLGIIASMSDGTRILKVCDCEECRKEPRSARTRNCDPERCARIVETTSVWPCRADRKKLADLLGRGVTA